MDATENEVQDYSFESYPTLKYFKEGSIQDELKVVDFYGDRTFGGITSFLKSNSNFIWIDIEESIKKVKKGHSDL